MKNERRFVLVVIDLSSTQQHAPQTTTGMVAPTECGGWQARLAVCHLALQYVGVALSHSTRLLTPASPVHHRHATRQPGGAQALQHLPLLAPLVDKIRRLATLRWR